MEKIRKYWKEIIIPILFIGLITVSTCSHNNQLRIEGEKVQLEKDLKEIKTQIAEAEKSTKKLLDSLSEEDIKKDKQIAKLNKSNKQLADRQKLREKELEKEKEKIASYSYTESAQMLSTRYNTEAITATETAVNLGEDIPNKVIIELAEKDVCYENSADKDKTIENKDEEIKLEKEKTLNANLKVASIQVEKELLKDGLQKSEEINKKSQKQIKSLRAKNFVNKIFVIGAFVGGILISNQL